MEIWAAIDLHMGRVVTLAQGDASRRTEWKDSPLSLARRWEEEKAHGLHIVDLDGAFGTGSNQEIIEEIVKQSKIPVELGGGLRTTERAKRWLDYGVERVVLGTLAFSGGQALAALLEEYGPERIVVAADYRDGMIVSKGWKESEKLKLTDAIKRLEEAGVEHVLATCVGCDGMGVGPDIPTLMEVCRSTRMKILASGGIRSIRDIEEVEQTGAEGVVLGRALYEGTIDLAQAAR